MYRLMRRTSSWKMEQIAKNINFAICITVRYADGKNNGGTLQEK